MRAAEDSGARAWQGRMPGPTRVRSVRFFAQGDMTLASSRLRAWLLSDTLSNLDVRSRTVVGASRPGLRALLRRSDVTVIQKWTPPAPVLAILRLTSSRLILDVDDAIYLAGTNRVGKFTDRNRRRFLRNIKSFDGATVSTTRIAEDLKGMKPDLPVLVYPGPVRLRSHTDGSRSGALWLGSPATERYLAPWVRELRMIDEAIGFLAVGGTEATAQLGIRVAEWSSEAEKAALAERSVGILAQSSGLWEDRKSAYKVLEYITAGVIPVSEKIPAAVALLGEEYPFYFGAAGLADTALAAASLKGQERVRILSELTTRIAHYSFESVAQTWLSFIRGLAR